MEFASEMVVKATLAKLDIQEVPTTLDKDGRDRPPHLNSWRDGWRHLRFLLLFSPKWLLFYPGIALFTLCTLCFIALDQGPVGFSNVGFDLNTQLVFAAGILGSFQLILIAIALKMIGTTLGVLPASNKIRKLQKLVTFENSIAISLVGTVIALSLLTKAFYDWKAVSFGVLESFDVTRTAPEVRNHFNDFLFNFRRRRIY